MYIKFCFIYSSYKKKIVPDTSFVKDIHKLSRCYNSRIYSIFCLQPILGSTSSSRVSARFSGTSYDLAKSTFTRSVNQISISVRSRKNAGSTDAGKWISQHCIKRYPSFIEKNTSVLPKYLKEISNKLYLPLIIDAKQNNCVKENKYL